MNKDYDCPQIAVYVEEVRKRESKFKGLRFEHVKRMDNFVADELSKWVAERSKVPPGVFVQRQSKPSVDPKTVAGEAPPATQGDPQLRGTMPPSLWHARARNNHPGGQILFATSGTGPSRRKTLPRNEWPGKLKCTLWWMAISTGGVLTELCSSACPKKMGACC